MSTFQIPATVTVTDKLIRDELINAYEQGINYWAEIVPPAKTDLDDTRTPSERWADAILTGDGASLNETDEDGGIIETHSITRQKVAAGLASMAEKHPEHFADLVSENGDVITSDVMVQMIALGEIRYG